MKLHNSLNRSVQQGKYVRYVIPRHVLEEMLSFKSNPGDLFRLLENCLLERGSDGRKKEAKC